MCAAPLNQTANNVPPTEPCLVQQPVVFNIAESSSSSTGNPLPMPVIGSPVVTSKLEVQQVAILNNNPSPVIACQTDSSYVLESKIASMIKSKMFMKVTRMQDLLDYLMLYILGVRFNDMRTLMEKSMISVLSQIENGTIANDQRDGESVGVEESDLTDFVDELVKWCKMILESSKPVVPERRPRAKVKCTICEREVTDCNIRTHMRAHANNGPSACPVCKKQFANVYLLNRHQIIHDPERKRDFKCELCDFAAFTKALLDTHMVRHQKNPKLICATCGKTFTNKMTLGQHEKRHIDNTPSVCDICGKTYSDVACLNRHRKVVHEGLRKKYTCELCGDVFTDSKKFRQHKWRHDDYRPYKCDFCSKTFTDNKILKSHRMIHTGEKPYICNVCGRAFRQKVALTNHSYTHGASRPHQCQKCARQFIHKVYLERHICTFADEPNGDEKCVDDSLNEAEKVS